MKFILRKAPLVFVIKEINRWQIATIIKSRLIKMDFVMMI
jgi:hypothetical protein